jgi:hypothetical protein
MQDPNNSKTTNPKKNALLLLAEKVNFLLKQYSLPLLWLYTASIIKELLHHSYSLANKNFSMPSWRISARLSIPLFVRSTSE